MVPGWKFDTSEDERLVMAYDRSDPMVLEDWTGGEDLRDGSQYISVMVEATEDDEAAVLYVCVCSDGGEMEGGEVDGCDGGGGGGGRGGCIAGAVPCALVDGWSRGDVRRVGGGSEAIFETG